MITAARRKAVNSFPIAETGAAPPRAAEVDARTRALLHGAIVPTLLRVGRQAKSEEQSAKDGAKEFPIACCLVPHSCTHLITLSAS
jgi:hypothetical protein